MCLFLFFQLFTTATHKNSYVIDKHSFNCRMKQKLNEFRVNTEKIGSTCSALHVWTGKKLNDIFLFLNIAWHIKHTHTKRQPLLKSLAQWTDKSWKLSCRLKIVLFKSIFAIFKHITIIRIEINQLLLYSVQTLNFLTFDTLHFGCFLWSDMR